MRSLTTSYQSKDEVSSGSVFVRIRLQSLPMGQPVPQFQSNMKRVVQRWADEFTQKVACHISKRATKPPHTNAPDTSPQTYPKARGNPKPEASAEGTRRMFQTGGVKRNVCS